EIRLLGRAADAGRTQRLVPRADAISGRTRQPLLRRSRPLDIAAIAQRAGGLPRTGADLPRVARRNSPARLRRVQCAGQAEPMVEARHPAADVAGAVGVGVTGEKSRARDLACPTVSQTTTSCRQPKTSGRSC